MVSAMPSLTFRASSTYNLYRHLRQCLDWPTALHKSNYFAVRKIRICAGVVVLLLSIALCFSKPPKQTEVVIIGAGLSGLAAAYELKQAKVPFHILELAPRVGGRVSTVHYGKQGKADLYADSGMEEYWESNPAVKIMKALKLPHSSDVAVSSIILQKKLYPLGEGDPRTFQKSVFNAEELFSLNAFKTKIGPWIAELKPGKPIRPELMKLKEVSFGQYVKDLKLPPKVSEWIRVSIECEIGTGWERISALDGIAEFHIFLGDGEACYRVTGGNENFTQALAKFAGSKNISVNHRATKIVSRGNRQVEVHYLQTESREAGMVQANQVICTVPLFRLFEMQFLPPLSEKKLEAIQTMTWGAYFKAHVFLPARAARFWTTNDASILPVLTDSELGVIYDGNPHQAEPTKILSLLVHGDTAELFNLAPLDQARVRIANGLNELWPGIKAEIHDMEFYRYHPRAIAAWPTGRSRFDDLSNEIRRPENNVILAGDFTESSHSDGAFISAQRAVRYILMDRPKPK
jgi:monoamine oxidase